MSPKMSISIATSDQSMKLDSVNGNTICKNGMKSKDKDPAILPAGFVGEGIALSLHLCSDTRPDNRLQLTVVDDSKEKVLVGLVIPLRRHVAYSCS